MNLSEICRLCLIKSSKNSEEIFFPLDTSFSIKFEEITHTRLEECENLDYPKKVCISCVTELEQHYNYRNSLIENQKRLKLLLDVNEEDENDENIETEILDEQFEDEVQHEDEIKFDQEDIQYEIVEEVYEKDEEATNKMTVEEYLSKSEEDVAEDAYLDSIPYGYFESLEEDEKKKKKKYSKTKNQIYSCWITGCNQKVGFRSSMKRHMLLSHQITITKSTCLLCGQFFEHYSDYLAHVKLHTRQYTCDICMLTFVGEDQLAKHKERIHNTIQDELRIHECTICKARFKRQEHVDSHMIYKHSDPSARKFKCSQCPSAFYRRSDLKTHEKGHTGVMMKCIYCDYSRRDVKSLKRHTMKVHNSTKLYKCLCEEEFDSHRELQQHKKQCSIN